jgi:hypothetical protein
MDECKNTLLRDVFDLGVAAQTAVNSSLFDGFSKHPPGSWREGTIGDQLKRIEAHITQYQCGDRSEDHLAHIVCRAAIAFALRPQSSALSFPRVSGARGIPEAKTRDPSRQPREGDKEEASD